MRLTILDRLVSSRAPFVVVVAMALACGSSSPTDDNQPTNPNGSSGGFEAPGTLPSGGGGDGTGGAGGEECKKMDIVFVVDDSNSMEEEQENLAANFPKFASVIDQYKTKSGATLDYRLAVTTTKRDNEQGSFRTKRGATAPKDCDAGPDRPWLERSDGAVAGMFSCRAQVGTKGGSPEQSLESVFLGLTERIKDATNTSSGATFLREDALLAFVAITDEDEGGTEDTPERDVSEYPALFDAIKGQRERWAAAVIAGEQKCSSDGFGEAAEAKRLKQFIGQVGKNGIFSSICSGDLTDGLTKALATFDQACKSFPTGPK